MDCRPTFLCFVVLSCVACGGGETTNAGAGGSDAGNGGATSPTAGSGGFQLGGGGSAHAGGSSAGSSPGGTSSAGSGALIDAPFVPKRLASGSAQNCVITKDQALYCWGFGSGGGGAAKYTQVSHQTEHHCAVDTTGKIDCFESSPLQTAIPTGSFVEVRVGVHAACAKDIASKLTCWTDGFAESAPILTGIPDQPVKHFYISNDTGCAVLQSGTTTCWGPTLASPKRNMPPRTDFLVVGGDVALFGIAPDQTIIGWGFDLVTPEAPPGNDYVQIAGGESHTAGLHADGTVTVVGIEASPAPGGVKFVEISAGNGQTCGIDTAGAVHCWGNGTTAWFKSPPDTVRAF